MEGDSWGGRERERRQMGGDSTELFSITVLLQEQNVRGYEWLNMCFLLRGQQHALQWTSKHCGVSAAMKAEKGRKNVDNLCRFKTNIFLNSSAER